MKILLATYWYLPHVGGVSTHVYGLKRELERLGHEVDILAHHPDMQKYYMPNNGRFLEKPKVKDLIYEKVLAFYKENISQVDPWIRWREIERYSFEAAASVFGLTKYDLIHTHDIVSTRALWRVKPKEVPLIATIHGCLATEFIISGEVKSRESLQWKYVEAEELYGGTSSNITIVPTQWLKDLMVNDFKVPADHISVIPYGMDIDGFIEKTEKFPKLDRPTDKKVIVCPARLVPVKGQQYLLDALARLKQERSDWICWIIGDGELRRSLEQQAQKLNLNEEVIFLGNREDVPSLLKQADIFVLPSLQDNQPFSVMEAQLAAKPVVVSDAGGIPEMVEHGKTGLIVPAGESKPLYKNLEQLLANDVLRNQLAENAQKFAMEQWSLHTMMERIFEVYKNIAGRKVH
ncbi:glycosyltransferase family 4 protein [Bacillus sp. CECT 9360]|uniref:glycosyltransferase family 4 protein n=1 Tax=Bacillus sp. CECT 9360 TaxID=2845821 RepID=UPI001E4AA148|nr:glycosyltransferase family 4 protein [Bacillus sp. CECT 9360]CAH0345467.1 D-inositol-3-phosphate glycosyltransferase [Bacillus sp. CECT 9360]